MADIDFDESFDEDYYFEDDYLYVEDSFAFAVSP